jgi:hypothetical protein
VLGLGLAGPVLLAAGCGGSKSPPVASLTTTSQGAGRVPASPGSPASTPGRAAFATCLGRHGFAASVGSAAAAPGRAVAIFGVVVTGNVDPTSPQFQTALRACRRYLPGGGPPSSTPAQRAQWATAMTAFAACMRRNGVPAFPDPSGEGTFPFGGLKGIDPSSPLVHRAFAACQSLEPKNGPHLQL